MLFLSKKHEKRFYEACSLIDTGYDVALAACYLLTSKKRLWDAFREAVDEDEIRFEKVGFRPRDLNEQALYNAAYDIYNCSDAILLCDLSDPSIVPDKSLRAIAYALMYLRFGFDSGFPEIAVRQYQ